MDSWAAYKYIYHISKKISILQVCGGKWPTPTQWNPSVFNNVLSFFWGVRVLLFKDSFLDYWAFCKLSRTRLDQFGRKGSGTSSLSKFTAMTIEEEDEEITHEESKMLRERFFEGQHFGWCFLRCRAFSKTIDFASGTLVRECSLSCSLVTLILDMFQAVEVGEFWKHWHMQSTISGVYICISFPRFWLMGPIVLLIRKWGTQQITRCLILTWNAVERPRNVFKCQMEKVIEDWFV